MVESDQVQDLPLAETTTGGRGTTIVRGVARRRDAEAGVANADDLGAGERREKEGERSRVTKGGRLGGCGEKGESCRSSVSNSEISASIRKVIIICVRWPETFGTKGQMIDGGAG